MRYPMFQLIKPRTAILLTFTFINGVLVKIKGLK